MIGPRQVWEEHCRNNLAFAGMGYDGNLMLTSQRHQE
jgi:hypothetical protein